jgi:D-alanyl-D-alanine carboxypeptidase/D-alanyl-D-alanine-endopeptidase (penicillin-binding protein 4)
VTRAAARCLALTCALAAAHAVRADFPGQRLGGAAGAYVRQVSTSPLPSDLDRIFADPVLSRALMAVRVERLRDGQVVYALNDDKHVMPASNMKLVTLAVAAERLGWNFRYMTRLDATGSVVAGTLHGDLVVTGGGDPSIASLDGGPAPLLGEWVEALQRAGISRIDGRIIGDDDAFDDEGFGAGWAWDNLPAGYSAPSGALSYNENAALLRIQPGRNAGDSTRIDITPPGHQLTVSSQVRTAAAGTEPDLSLARLPGSPRLTIRGTVPAGGATLERTAAVDNPTRFFVEAFRLALASRDIRVTGGAWDIDDLNAPPAADRRLIARHESAPLAELAGYFMKVSQNFYAETLLKTLGRVVKGSGTSEAGRAVIGDTLAEWGVPAGAVVVSDGSGLSRYNYVTAGTIVTILTREWRSEQSRGPFTAALPVAGHDGTLEKRMNGTMLEDRVEAKTGTLSNVRALSGYLETRSGERLVFSMIANNFTAPGAAIDAVVERALARLAEE